MRPLLSTLPNGRNALPAAHASFTLRVLRRFAALTFTVIVPSGLALAQDAMIHCAAHEGTTSVRIKACDNAPSRASTGAQKSRRPAAVAVPAPAPSRKTATEAPAQASTSDVTQWAKGADVIVVAGHDTRPLTQVNITHAAKPVMLVLTSRSATRWVVLPSPGTRIKAIVVSARDQNEIDVQAPPGVPVLVDTLPYAYEASNIRFRELMSKLNARYGVERVLTLRGGSKLPPVISVTGPFVLDENLTLAGMRAEAPRLRFSFKLPGIDGRALPFTNTGPADGNRYTGIIQSASSTAPRTRGAMASDDGGATYYLQGNGGTLMWAPSGLSGKSEEIKLPATMPPLSWGSGLAWDTRKGVLAIVSHGGEGYFYRYDTRQHTWLDSHSLLDRDFLSVALNPTTRDYVAISATAELARFNALGEVLEIVPLIDLLSDLDSTYDKHNGRLQNLVVAADGEATAVLDVRNGTVTHIWTYDHRTRKAQLTYKPTE
jgi:hypothetical protein